MYPESILYDHFLGLVQVCLATAVSWVLLSSEEEEDHVNLDHPEYFNVVDGLSLGAFDLDFIGVKELFDAFAVAHFYIY